MDAENVSPHSQRHGPSPSPPVRDARRVLVVQLAGIGDLFLAGPALRALRRLCPGATIDLLTTGRAKVAAEGCPYVDRLIPWDGRAGWRGALGMRAFLKLTGARLLAGRDTAGRGSFYHRALREPSRLDRHERDSKLALIALLGGDASEARLEVWPGPEDEELVGELLAEARFPAGSPLVGVNPGSDRPVKNWEEGRFLAVARALAEEEGACFVLTGGEAEAPLTARLAHALGPCALDTVGRISFRATAPLLRRLDLFLTCDTAAMHLAWAAGTPTVSLFGPGDVRRYAPRGPRHRVLGGDAHCSPCTRRTCGEWICMPGISEEAVLAACRELLAERRAGGEPRGRASASPGLSGPLAGC